jgi:methyltransferase (TIGR00027 family)
MAPAAVPAAIQSAETLAALRAVADGDLGLATPCSDGFARHFLTPRNRFLLNLVPHGLLKAVLNMAAPGGYPFAIARTRHFDEALLAGLGAGIAQVVILGAGYDSRALRFRDKLAGVRVFELDHPGTQGRKTRLLQQSDQRLPDNVTLIGIDFARQSFRTALAEHGFRTDVKTLFLWEGVSYYLPEAAVSEVLGFVGTCAAGSSIVFDYALARFVDGDTSTYGGRQVARWLQRIGEPFLFGLDPAEAPGFLTRHRMHVASHLGPADLERLYLATADGRPGGRTLGHLRIIEGRSTGSR